MRSSCCQASGTIIIMASGRSRPQCISSSSTVSYDPESDCVSGTIGSSCIVAPRKFVYCCVRLFWPCFLSCPVGVDLNRGQEDRLVSMVRCEGQQMAICLVH